MVYRQHQLSGPLEKSLRRQHHHQLLLWVLTGWGPPLSLDPGDSSFPSALKTQLLVPSPLPLGATVEASWAVIMAPGGPRFQMPFPSAGEAPHPAVPQLAVPDALPFLSPNSPFHQLPPLHSNSRPSTYQISIRTCLSLPLSTSLPVCRPSPPPPLQQL